MKKEMSKYVEGYDISRWQGNIDFTEVAKHVDFLIIQAMQSDVSIDPRAVEYCKAAEAHHIPYALYTYSLATSYAQGMSEADALFRFVKEYDLHPSLGYAIDMEILYDKRVDKNKVTAESISDACFGFCKAVEDNGGYAIIYVNDEHYKLLNNEYKERYAIWYADRKFKQPTEETIAEYVDYHKGKYRIWQHSSEWGDVGITENTVDHNYMARETMNAMMDVMGIKSIDVVVDSSVVSLPGVFEDIIKEILASNRALDLSAEITSKVDDAGGLKTTISLTGRCRDVFS